MTYLIAFAAISICYASTSDSGSSENILTGLFSSVSGWYDSLMSLFSKPDPSVSEIVTCKFNSATKQTCYSSNGYNCSGVLACAVTVKGLKGDKVYWNSTCGAYGGYTLIDGINDIIYLCTKTPNQINSTNATVSETVTCHFNSTVNQSCYSSKGSNCSGLYNCSVKLSGQSGEKVSWNSTCGQYSNDTVMDGKNETIYFFCNSTNTAISEVVACYFNSASVQSCYSSKGTSCSGLSKCLTNISGQKGEIIYWNSSYGGTNVSIVNGTGKSLFFYNTTNRTNATVFETVTCSFGASANESCISSKGEGCRGIGSCKVNLTGSKGESVYWDCSCGSKGVSTMDGINETVYFCNSTNTTNATVSETVKCHFNSTTSQSCYSSKGPSCSGLYDCLVNLTGQKGEKIYWNTSCGSYSNYTTIDGTNKTIYIFCNSTNTTNQTNATILEGVACIFNSSMQVETCYSSKGPMCSGRGWCGVNLVGQKGEKVYWNSTCNTTGVTTIDGINETLELCYTYPMQDYNNTLREAVVCVFNSSTQQGCYSSQGTKCSSVRACSTDVMGSKGEKVYWNSTCGQVATTTIDGTVKTIHFC